MKVLVINGSPKGENSNTIRLTDAFLQGMKNVGDVAVETVTLVKEKINPCCGCFSCWGATPGKCVISDGMDAIREKILQADVIIESFPLYFFGMPAQMKAFTDRMMPFTEAYCGESAEGKTDSLHAMRYGITSKKMIVISTCGYTDTVRIYEALEKEYNCICGPNGYTFLTCPQGELFHVEQLAELTNARLKLFTKAGEEWMHSGCVKEAVRQELCQPMIPKRAFEMVLKANWQAAKEEYDRKSGLRDGGNVSE